MNKRDTHGACFAPRSAIAIMPALGLLAVVSSARAQQTYYVAPPSSGGSDSNPGSAAAPWATLQFAANRVVAGDTVIVCPGTFAGFNVGEPHSGTPAAPITFRAMPGVIVNTEAARFNGQTHHARINLDTVSHIVIEGFEVVGTNDQRSSKAGIRMVAPPDSTPEEAGFITIRNCHVHHNGEWGVFSGHVHGITVEDCLIHDTADEHGIYLSNSGDNHIIRRNVIHSNSSNGIHLNADASQGGDGIITGVLVENNIIRNNGGGSVYINASGATVTSPGGGSGINCDGVRDSRFQNNLLDNNHASGISLYRIDGLLPSSNNVIANNTIVNGSAADTRARWCLNISDASTGTIVFNNVLLNFHPFRGSLIITSDSLLGGAGSGGLFCDYNIVMDRFDADGDDPGGNLTLAQWQALTGLDAHSISLPPSQWGTLFVDLAAGDLRLENQSPARDAGAPALHVANAPPYDLIGTPRPRGEAFDIGAYEYTSCPADWNRDNVVNSADYFDFLVDLYAGTGDFNGSGMTDSQDFFDFLAAFF
ncbi:MAG: right-handed parallel beta-helix repeat-containing protein, partial [Phycisphaerales bacterium]